MKNLRFFISFLQKIFFSSSQQQQQQQPQNFANQSNNNLENQNNLDPNHANHAIPAGTDATNLMTNMPGMQNFDPNNPMTIMNPMMSMPLSLPPSNQGQTQMQGQGQNPTQGPGPSQPQTTEAQPIPATSTPNLLNPAMNLTNMPNMQPMLGPNGQPIPLLGPDGQPLIGPDGQPIPMMMPVGMNLPVSSAAAGTANAAIPTSQPNNPNMPLTAQSSLPLTTEIKPPTEQVQPKPAASKFKFLQKGREICTTCQTTVYAAEKTLGPKNKIYHKMCLRCLSCNKALASGSFVDHDSEPFCKGCYAKYFGPRGIGFGTLSFAQ